MDAWEDWLNLSDKIESIDSLTDSEGRPVKMLALGYETDKETGSRWCDGPSPVTSLEKDLPKSSWVEEPGTLVGHLRRAGGGDSKLFTPPAPGCWVRVRLGGSR